MASTHQVARARQDGTLFGIPLGDLSLFQTLLMSFASGFAAFFAATFLGIISLLVVNASTGRHIDYAIAYKRIGFPIGLLTLATALALLGTFYARQRVRKG